MLYICRDLTMRPFRPPHFLLALSLYVSGNAQVPQGVSCTATIETIGEQIGNIVVFCGTPTQVSAPEKVKGDPVYLNFGGNYPNHQFSVVIWEDVSGKKREKLVGKYTGKSLRIRGWVKERDGKLELTVKTLEDITVLGK